jgi:hypothetical protein
VTESLDFVWLLITGPLCWFIAELAYEHRGCQNSLQVRILAEFTKQLNAYLLHEVIVYISKISPSKTLQEAIYYKEADIVKKS